MESELRKLKVAELRDQLQSRGLDTKGVKDELVARLAEAMAAEEAAPAANGEAEAAPAEPPAQEAAAEEPEEVGSMQAVERITRCAIAATLGCRNTNPVELCA